MFRALEGKSRLGGLGGSGRNRNAKGCLWLEQVPALARGVGLPAWPLVVPKAFAQRRSGLKETVLEGAIWGQCALFKEGDVISTSLEEQETGVSPHRFSLRLFC